MPEYLVSVRLRKNKAALIVNAYPVGTHLYLLPALLSRHIKHLLASETKSHLQKQCRFPYARLTTDEHQGAGDKTSAKDTVKLLETDINTPLVSTVNVKDWDRH